MERIEKPSTASQPDLLLDPNAGLIQMKGKLLPEDPLGYFEYIFEWIEQYKQQPQPNTEVRLGLEYFNTGASKALLIFFERLAQLNDTTDTGVAITWMYEAEDYDLQEAGENYASMIKLPIQMVEVDRL